MKINLELLAPAGNAEIGRAAIDHGADALYIGAPMFSARAQAGNSIEEIAGLVQFAHLFRSRVYVALNTILTDAEIEQARDLIHALYDIRIDGLIIQDTGLLELDLPPIPLIASTQMHNASAERIQFLESVGFKRIILARELSIDEIRNIRKQTTVELETFVHGALCVSYSGRCYMSQYSSGRSGNRGVCAQPCRHRYSLVDAKGNTLIENKYLLSLRDMKRLEFIGDLAAAGVTSFKIEGRYKEIEYVKNITAAYRLAVDEFISQNSRYCRAGSGDCTFSFKPDPEKSFNRGFTEYFLHGRQVGISSMDSPKSRGQFAGRVKGIGPDYFIMDGHDLANGDGLCFYNVNMELTGCRVNRTAGNRIYPNTMTGLEAGSAVYRNSDSGFLRILKGSSHCRTIGVQIIFDQDETGIRLTVKDEDGVTADLRQEIKFEPARNPANARTNIEIQLGRTKDTPYRVTGVAIRPEQPGFLALSTINDLRRRVLAELTQTRIERFYEGGFKIIPNGIPFPEKELDYRANILNSRARAFYERHGAKIFEMALESGDKTPEKNNSERVVMTTKYCLRHELGACLKSGDRQNKRTLIEPLRISDRQNTYRLEFDCGSCRMMVIAEKK